MANTALSTNISRLPVEFETQAARDRREAFDGLVKSPELLMVFAIFHTASAKHRRRAMALADQIAERTPCHATATGSLILAALDASARAYGRAPAAA